MANDGPESRAPITGVYEPPEDERLRTPPHTGFDKAWEDAIDQADRSWRREEKESIEVTVEFEARLDFWNPGGIGQYRVKISEGP
jgi:hypothetical protein